MAYPYGIRPNPYVTVNCAFLLFSDPTRDYSLGLQQ